MIPVSNRLTGFRPARLVCAALPVCLLLTACDPVDAPSAAHRGRYKAPPLPDGRRQATPKPETSQWLAAWRALRAELDPLQVRMAELQKLHTQNDFDKFLELDPETLERDQLCTLFHFLERSYFTVERRILLNLLKRRLNRPEPATSVLHNEGGGMKDRIAAAMQRDELRMVDIESAIELYSKATAADIQIPNALTDHEIEELRTTVAGMLEKTRDDVAALDRILAVLKAEAFPDQFPMPEEEPAPPAQAVTTSTDGAPTGAENPETEEESESAFPPPTVPPAELILPPPRDADDSDAGDAVGSLFPTEPPLFPGGEEPGDASMQEEEQDQDQDQGEN